MIMDRWNTDGRIRTDRQGRKDGRKDGRMWMLIGWISICSIMARNNTTVHEWENLEQIDGFSVERPVTYSYCTSTGG